MRKLEFEINRLATDAANFLSSIDFFLIAVKLRPLRAVVVRAEVRFCHQKSTSFLRCFLLFMFFIDIIEEIIQKRKDTLWENYFHE